jgi:hypothetical protein
LSSRKILGDLSGLCVDCPVFSKLLEWHPQNLASSSCFGVFVALLDANNENTPPMMALTLYSRPGCHLCDEMKAVIERVADTTALTVDVIDISTDAELESRYGLEIPVLLVNGKKAAKYRLSEAELTLLLKGRSRQSER